MFSRVYHQNINSIIFLELHKDERHGRVPSSTFIARMERGVPAKNSSSLPYLRKRVGDNYAQHINRSSRTSLSAVLRRMNPCILTSAKGWGGGRWAPLQRRGVYHFNLRRHIGSPYPRNRWLSQNLAQSLLVLHLLYGKPCDLHALMLREGICFENGSVLYH
ncbi:hypothetical protein AVEN_26298-1 [Araneus ventricosus]|uniref:Uncharacterized protein n=1 Tax=Araneus ventricosus TaxID=182803 RepID=A0A4Y2AMD1_ARAVE|nr:hypothetical protein AVEN_26298-1 [Araneus ventricosus]